MSGLEFVHDETNTTDLSAKFYSHFQTLKNDIAARLELGPKTTTGVDFTALSSDIVKLRKDLLDATPYLPSYDRGKCEQQLKELETSLSRHRTPKPKFAFKRKPAGTPPPAAAAPTPTPITRAPAPTNTTSNITLSSQTSAHLTLSSLSLPSHDAASSPTSEVPRSSDITLTDLSMCIVDLFNTQDHTSQLTITALHARALHRVVLVIPPIEGSVLLHNIQDSIVVVGCHQFRMHDSNNTIVLLHAISTPIVEGSRNIQFGAYPTALRDASTSMQNFFTRPSQHASAQDFDWIKPSASPNWRILDPATELADNVVRLVNEGKDLDDVAGALEQILPQP